MSLEILSQINQNYLAATEFHRNQADLMLFMSFPGFCALHEFQYAEESQVQRRLKRYILTTYRTPVYDSPAAAKNIFKDQMDGKDRKNLTGTEKWSALQQSWIEYERWEQSALNLYEQLGKQLIDEGALADFVVVQPIIKDVSEELRNVSDILNALQSMDFDMPTVTSMQLEMQEKYTEKLRNLYKEIPPA